MVECFRGKATNGEIKGSRVGVAAGSVRQRAGHPKADTHPNAKDHNDAPGDQTQPDPEPWIPLTHLISFTVPPFLCSFMWRVREAPGIKR